MEHTTTTTSKTLRVTFLISFFFSLKRFSLSGELIVLKSFQVEDQFLDLVFVKYKCKENLSFSGT